MIETDPGIFNKGYTRLEELYILSMIHCVAFICFPWYVWPVDTDEKVPFDLYEQVRLNTMREF